MINFNLMEYQLDDVRRAVTEYLHRRDQMNSGAKVNTVKMAAFNCNDRHALRDLANQVVNIVLESGVNDGLPG